MAYGKGFSAKRTRPAWEGKASGLHRTLEIREGFTIALADVTYYDNARLRHRGNDLLKLHCKLDGRSLISDERGEFVPVEAGLLSVLVQPADSEKSEKVHVDTHERSVTMICEREFAASMIRDSREGLPRAVDDLLRGRKPSFTLLSLPLPFEMRRVVEEVLDPPYSGPLADLMLEAKSLELLGLSLQQIHHAPDEGCAVRSRDLQKVRDLCALLTEEPRCNLTSAELSSMLAWNETQMMDCFKKVTGTTISHFRHMRRMEEAMRNIQTSDTSITEIAFDAGYEHANNFTTAFKRTFGITPKTARNQGACAGD